MVLVAAVVGLMTAANMGEKSPAYARGQVSLPAALSADAASIKTLFIVVYDEDSPMPMPYGAMKERLRSPITAGEDWSFDFLITKEKLQVMNERALEPKRMRLKVRLDRDGVAGPDQPGDLTGQVQGVPFGSQDVQIAIEQVVAGS